jgi:hypothetical protein
MAYIDKTFYDGYHPGHGVDGDDLTILMERASIIIDHLTQNQISQFGLSDFTAAHQDMIKKAVAAQVDTLDEFGGVSALNGGNDAAAVSIGKFSRTSKLAPTGKQVNGIPVSPMVDLYLLPTGLLFCGMGNPNLRRG